MKKKGIIFCILSYVLMLIVNFLGATGRINQSSQEFVSDKYRTLITPAGYTFSIWSLIYLLIFVLLIKMFISSSKEQKDLKEFSHWFVGSCMLNALWIVAYSYQQIAVSVIIIFGLLFVLCQITQRFTQNRLSQVTFGLYTGWILQATVINMANFFVAQGFRGGFLSEEMCSALVLCAATAILIYVSSKLDNIFIYLSAIWAFIGIFVGLKKDVFVSAVQFLPIVTFLLTAVCIILFIIQWRRTEPYRA